MLNEEHSTKVRLDPLQGLTMARRYATITIIGSILGFVIAPNTLYFNLIIIIAAWLFRRRCVNLAAQISAEIVAARTALTYNFPSIPVSPDARDAAWEPEDVCFDRVVAQELIRETAPKVQPWYQDVTLAELVPTYKAQMGWLKTACPDRWRIVQAWWLHAWVLPAIRRRWPLYEFRLHAEAPTEESGDYPERWRAEHRPQGSAAETPWVEVPTEWTQEVARDYQCQRFHGVRMACQPKLWSPRIDARPSWTASTWLLSALFHACHGVLPKGPELPAEIRHTRTKYAKRYVGHGFHWDKRHTEALYLKMGEDRNVVDGVLTGDGDARIPGIGAKETRPIFVEEPIFNLHLSVVGKPGSGKTVFITNVLVQAIESGMPMFHVDPKLDRDCLNLAAETARRCGRWNQFHLFHLNAPLCPEVSSYNPLYNYDLPSELASRAAAVIPVSKDPFWQKTGIATAKAVFDLTHYTMEFMRVISSRKVDHEWVLGERFDDKPPMLLLALIYRMTNPTRKAPEIRVILEDYLLGRTKPGYKVPEHLKYVHDAMRNPMFTTKGWVPNLKPVNIFGISSPHSFVAWCLRTVYLHLWINDASMAPPNMADRIDSESVIGDADHSWWMIYQRDIQHPLLAYGDAILHAEMPPAVMAIYEEFLPKAAINSRHATRILHEFKSALNTMRGLAKEDPKEHKKHMTTLRSALANFEGERERLVNATDPDVVLAQVIRKNQIVYFVTNYMKDPEASEGICRIAAVDAMGLMGSVYGQSARGRYDFVFSSDEAITWLSEQVITMQAQARGAGLRVALLLQTRDDLEDKMESRAKAGRVLGNCGTKISTGSGSLDDAKQFSEFCGKVNIRVPSSYSLNTTKSYGSTGLDTVGDYNQSENITYSDKDIELIQPSWILNLPTGYAFLNNKQGTMLIISGRQPPAKTNLLAEFNLLEYDAQVQPPAEIERRIAELVTSNGAIEPFIAMRNARAMHRAREERIKAMSIREDVATDGDAAPKADTEKMDTEALAGFDGHLPETSSPADVSPATDLSLADSTPVAPVVPAPVVPAPAKPPAVPTVRPAPAPSSPGAIPKGTSGTDDDEILDVDSIFKK